ncbi:hypothetical protein EYF80_060607 [Liparis tanakae]|uniref:Uncharacterized protein n=1 Tax=Liparis tanakae TaxID=230148 RepID=A0A4Z2EKG9_9TELE|nr:hypothetical protein EYF80_060607 [Liparis tanakae]
MSSAVNLYPPRSDTNIPVGEGREAHIQPAAVSGVSSPSSGAVQTGKTGELTSLPLWLGLGPASCDPAERMSGCHPPRAAEALPVLPVRPLREAIIFSYLP